MTPHSATGRELRVGGDRLSYVERGAGDRAVVLLSGMALPASMQAPLAEGLAERGFRVICLELLGHGRSDRPVDSSRYSMPLFARQVVGALDALELDEVVLGGASLGANVTLETAVLAPERLNGIVVEGAWTDGAQLALGLGWPLLFGAVTLGRPLVRALAPIARRLVPRGMSVVADIPLDWLAQDPAATAALMQGVYFERKAPPREERERIATRALVIATGGYDPVHPISDSEALVDELRDAELVRAGSILELRRSPVRLTEKIAGFCDECFSRGGEVELRSAV